MSQMKGRDKTLEKQLNEVEMGNLPEKEFRIMIVKMIQYLGKTTEKMQEMFTKKLTGGSSNPTYQQIIGLNFTEQGPAH